MFGPVANLRMAIRLAEDVSVYQGDVLRADIMLLAELTALPHLMIVPASYCVTRRCVQVTALQHGRRKANSMSEHAGFERFISPKYCP
jgi:hypothetical protein